MLRVSICLIVFVCAASAFAQEMESAAPALMVETQFCAGIEDRMPVGAAESFSVDVGTVYLWCKVTGAQDSTSIKFVWSRQGEEMAQVELPVKSSSWRTWSSKNLLPEWTGNWEVKIHDAQGEVLKAVTFTVTPAVEKPAMEDKPVEEPKPEPEPEPEPEPSDSLKP